LRCRRGIIVPEETEIFTFTGRGAAKFRLGIRPARLVAGIIGITPPLPVMIAITLIAIMVTIVATTVVSAAIVVTVAIMVVTAGAAPVIIIIVEIGRRIPGIVTEMLAEEIVRVIIGIIVIPGMQGIVIILPPRVVIITVAVQVIEIIVAVIVVVIFVAVIVIINIRPGRPVSVRAV